MAVVLFPETLIRQASDESQQEGKQMQELAHEMVQYHSRICSLTSAIFHAGNLWQLKKNHDLHTGGRLPQLGGLLKQAYDVDTMYGVTEMVVQHGGALRFAEAGAFLYSYEGTMDALHEVEILLPEFVKQWEQEGRPHQRASLVEYVDELLAEAKLLPTKMRHTGEQLLFLFNERFVANHKTQIALEENVRATRKHLADVRKVKK